MSAPSSESSPTLGVAAFLASASNHKSGTRIYVAGPLFTKSERAEVDEIATILEAAGYATFVPHRDGLMIADLVPRLLAAGCTSEDAQRITRKAIFDLDIFEVVDHCGALVFNLNGRVPDEGAVAEAGIAWILAKPTVLYKNDPRSHGFGMDNPLIAGLGNFKTVQDMALIPVERRRRRSDCSSCRTAHRQHSSPRRGC